ncbi:MAG: hypothetical protein AB8B73_06580 [Ekhidna sp.]
MKSISIFLATLLLIGCAGESDGEFSLGDGSGVSSSGSYSTFTVVDNFLYIVKNDVLETFNIQSGNTSAIKSEQIGAVVETLFRYDEYLLVGTQTGVLIYDISIRSNPKYVSSYSHQTGCDPVIARNDIAYITVRDGFSCNSRLESNILIVLDISNIKLPQEINQIEMNDPRGLTIVQNKLLVGEGVHGLAQFDITDPQSPILDLRYPDIYANDMITLDSIVIIQNENELLQYQMINDSLRHISRL